MEQPPQVIADGASHLKGRALPPSGAAAQVGQYRSHKDGRQQQNRQSLTQADYVDDVVGSLPLGTGELVKGHNGNTCQRQTPQEPGKASPQQLRLMDADVERRSYSAA